MKLPLSIFALSLGCIGSTVDEPDEEIPVCDQVLPPTNDGSPWPSYSAANATLSDCDELEGYWFRRRGSCSDGKLFLEKGSGFVGDTQYFTGEVMVGISSWTDIVGPCEAVRRGDATCEEVDSEEISCTP